MRKVRSTIAYLDELSLTIATCRHAACKSSQVGQLSLQHEASTLEQEIHCVGPESGMQVQDRLRGYLLAHECCRDLVVSSDRGQSMGVVAPVYGSVLRAFVDTDFIAWRRVDSAW